jgi:Uri superfamily endonuclease
VGSAFGPGGVAARCGHHRRISERPRWHIDYLRTVFDLKQIWFTHDPLPREHLWATRLSNDLGYEAPVHQFGASGCDCVSHLFHSAVKPDWRRFKALSLSADSGESPVLCEIV